MHAERGTTVTRVTEESTGHHVRRRREALGKSVRQLAEDSGVHRNTIGKIEADDPSVEDFTVQRLLRALDRLEHRYSTHDPERVLSRVTLPDGTTAVFEGSPDGVAEALAKFLESRNG